MPNNVVSLSNLKKHMTAKEKKARATAEQAVTRDKVTLTMPDFLKDDAAATAYWDRIIKAMRGLCLLDDLDTDMLGVYCCQLSRHESLYALCNQLMADDHDQEATAILLRIEGTERLLLAYAEKLGLTPSSRVRMAKKKAEERPVDPHADLFGDS